MKYTNSNIKDISSNNIPAYLYDEMKKQEHKRSKEMRNNRKCRKAVWLVSE